MEVHTSNAPGVSREFVCQRWIAHVLNIPDPQHSVRASGNNPSSIRRKSDPRWHDLIIRFSISDLRKYSVLPLTEGLRGKERHPGCCIDTRDAPLALIDCDSENECIAAHSVFEPQLSALEAVQENATADTTDADQRIRRRNRRHWGVRPELANRAFFTEIVHEDERIVAARN
jgi:hypothetical protein